jgi:predicted dehydrogenase
MDVEIVVVASPNRTHVPLGVQALKSGSPRRRGQADRDGHYRCHPPRRVAAQTGKVLSVYHNRRFDGDFLTVRSLVSEGTLGPIDSMESRFEIGVPLAEAWREDADEAGGPHRDLGAHLVDQALLLFGDPVRVFAQLDRRRPGTEVDDSAFVALEHRGGERSRIWTSLISPGGGHVSGSEDCSASSSRRSATRRRRAPWPAACRRIPASAIDEPEQWGGCTSSARNRDGPDRAGDYRRFYELFRDAVADRSSAAGRPSDAIRGLARARGGRASRGRARRQPAPV